MHAARPLPILSDIAQVKMQYFAARAYAHIDFMLFIEGMRLENDIVFLGLGRPAAVVVASAGIDLVLVIGLRCKK